MTWRLPNGYRQQVALANYVPGPLHPPGFFDDDTEVEDVPEVPLDYDYWRGDVGS